jgi:FkbH-like protein
MSLSLKSLTRPLRRLGRKVSEDKDGSWFLTPRELSITETRLDRVLIIGSCLSEIFGLSAPRRGPAVDFILFNHATTLPETPPQPVAGYNFQIIQFPLRDLLPDAFYFRTSFANISAHEELFDQAVARMRQMLGSAMKWNTEHGLLTFMINFLPPQQNPMGDLLPRCDLRNFVYFVRLLNDELSKEVQRYPNAYILDIDQISATLGRRYFQDDQLCALNHASGISEWDFHRDQNRISPVTRVTDTYETRTPEVLRAVWAEAERMYRIVRQIDLVKLVIVDLDDTLWRGLVLETGTISHDTTEGWPLGMAEALLFLKKRGVLLAIASKNDEAKVEAIWDDVWLDRLKLEDFAIRKINWKSKAENVGAIIAEAGLLPGNVVFIDDNPVERAIVAQSYPGIRVLGADPYVIRRILLWSSETQTAVVTDVSGRRTELMHARSEIEKLRTRLSREEFLATLGVTVTGFEIRDINDKRFARAFELINKTNQFNTTGRRLTTEDCVAMFKRGVIFHAFEVADKFSRYGLVAVGIVSQNAIEQFVMSCRVIGLDVETAAIAEVCARLRRNGASLVSAAFADTSANSVCRDVFARSGFVASDGGWTLKAEESSTKPAHVMRVSGR